MWNGVCKVPFRCERESKSLLWHGNSVTGWLHYRSLMTVSLLTHGCIMCVIYSVSYGPEILSFTRKMLASPSFTPSHLIYFATEWTYFSLFLSLKNSLYSSSLGVTLAISVLSLLNISQLYLLSLFLFLGWTPAICSAFSHAACCHIPQDSFHLLCLFKHSSTSWTHHSSLCLTDVKWSRRTSPHSVFLIWLPTVLFDVYSCDLI